MIPKAGSSEFWHNDPAPPLSLPAVLSAQPHRALKGLRVNTQQVLEAAPGKGATARAAKGSPIHWAGAAGTARPKGARQWKEARLLLFL